MIELLVGPIRSGKSTYAKQRALQGAVILNDDAVVMAVHGGNYRLYQKGLKPLYKVVENTILQMAITLGRDVIIDRPNMGRFQRARFISIARSLGEQVIAVTFPNHGPAHHAKTRFETDARGLTMEHWVAAAERHQSQFVQPDVAEGFTDIVPVSDILKALRKKPKE